MNQPEALAVALELITAARSDEDRTSAVETAKLLSQDMTEADIDAAIDQALDLITKARKEK
jgi:hypothetical protein